MPPTGLSCTGMPRRPTLIDREILCFTYNYGSLDNVLQFTNVTRPRIRLKQFQTLFVYPADGLSCFSRKTVDEVLDQHRNVFPSFPQRRHLDRKNVKPVKEVAPKCASSDSRLQVTIRGSNHPNVSANGSSSTDTLKLVLLQNTQQSDLGPGRKFSDFIEENCASFGQLKAP